jgi:diaminopimelate epimerase
MKIPFTKAHGAGNDFLMTWANEAPFQNLPVAARAICERHRGIGADGWILVAPAPTRSTEYDGSMRLFNSDGSEPEISGNGTRCAAAFLLDSGLEKTEVRILTGAGVKLLRLIDRDDLRFTFEMNMGRPSFSEADVRSSLPLSSGTIEACVLNVGNPQCVVFVDGFDFEWTKQGAEIESHPRFPNRTNVSFVRPVDAHTLDVRFFERGAGETLSSGTGSAGAVVAAVLRGLVKSPVRVMTRAGPLDLRYENEVYLTGPAEIVGGGVFYL